MSNEQLARNREQFNMNNKKQKVKIDRCKALCVFTLLFVLFSLIFGSCQNPVDSPKAIINEAGKGTLVLAIGEDGAGRTILPATMLDDFSSFTLDFTARSQGNTNFSRTWNSSSGTVELNVGTWDITVTAYLNSGEGEPREAARGELKGIVVPSGGVTGVVPLYPVTTGQGTFSWNIDYPASITEASMTITRIGNTSYESTFYFTGGETIIAKNGSIALEAGQYSVVLKLSNGEEEAALTEFLHIYRSMESVFTQSFSDAYFPDTLFKVIFDAWDSVLNEWDLTSAGITEEHFRWLGIDGITGSNFDAMVGRFNSLCSPGLIPNNLIGLKALADAALLGMAGEDAGFLAGYTDQVTAENAIIALALNGTALSFIWETDNKTVTVQSGGYEVPIVFTNALVPPTPGLAFSLRYNNTEYSVSKGTATATVVIIPSVFNGLPVTAIGDSGFADCQNMTSVTIPSSVTSIVGPVFRACSGLESITVAIGNTTYKSEGNCLIQISNNTLIAGCKNSVIPTSVESIGEYAFYGCSGLTSVTIPTSVESIGERAFSGCSGLTSVTIPSSVTSIGEYAFSWCSGLESVAIPEGVTSIGNYAFWGCSGLTNVFYSGANVAVWNGISIGSGNSPLVNAARYYYSAADPGTADTHWRFIEGVPEIWNVTTLVFTLINNGTAYSVSKGTSNILAVVIPSVYNELPVTAIGSEGFSNYRNMTSVAIPAGVTSIGSYAFYGCSGLTSVTIPEGVTSIGSYAFYGCSGLESITVAIGNTTYKSEGNCLIQISNNTLIAGCKKSVIPTSVTSIGSYAFSGCIGLTSVTIPSSVTNIGYSAFYGCARLKTVFYRGTNVAAWNNISINSENTPLTNATRYYYTETHPGTPNTHWRWVYGAETVWR